jgi:hypothetical protein
LPETAALVIVELGLAEYQACCADGEYKDVLIRAEYPLLGIDIPAGNIVSHPAVIDGPLIIRSGIQKSTNCASKLLFARTH